jgi:hypothetical protein
MIIGKLNKNVLLLQLANNGQMEIANLKYEWPKN